MSQFVDNEWFEIEHCCNCGIAFAMTVDFKRRRLKDHSYFYCPAGHSQHYTGKTEEQKLKEDLERRQQMLEAATARANRAENDHARVTKAHNRMRVRVMNGVCPCRNRTFQNLMQHMRSEHPDFGQQKSLRLVRDTFGMTQSDVAREAGVNSAYVSNYENDGYVPARAKGRLDAWLERHAAEPTE